MTKTKWIGISLAFVVFFLLFLSFGTDCQKEETVLRIGNSVVLKEEFNHRLNLTPAIHTDLGENGRKNSLARDLLVEMILAQEAVKRKLHQEEWLIRYLAQLKKETVYESVMKAEVSDRVNIDESQLLDVFSRMGEVRTVKYWVFGDRIAAENYLTAALPAYRLVLGG